MPQPRASATTLATSAPHPPPPPGPQAPQVGLRGRERGGSFEFQALPCCSALPLWLLSESSAGDASGGGGLVRLASPSKRSGEGLMTSTVDAATGGVSGSDEICRGVSCCVSGRRMRKMRTMSSAERPPAAWRPSEVERTSVEAASFTLR